MSELDIVGTIDGALTDWETSPDAMRWTTDEAVLAAAPSDDELDLVDAERVFAAIGQMATAMGAWAEQMRVGFTKAGEQLAVLLREHPELLEKVAPTSRPSPSRVGLSPPCMKEEK